MSDSSTVQSQKVNNGNYLADLQRQQTREINERKDEHEAKLETAGERQKKAMKETEAAYKVELTSTEDRFAEELSKLQTSHRLRLQQEQMDGEKSVKDMQDAYAKQIADVRSRSEKQLRSLREEFQDSENNMVRQVQRRRQAAATEEKS